MIRIYISAYIPIYLVILLYVILDKFNINVNTYLHIMLQKSANMSENDTIFK